MEQLFECNKMIESAKDYNLPEKVENDVNTNYKLPEKVKIKI